MRGGLREEQPGVWEVRIEAGRDPVTGRRRQLSRTVRGTKQEAERVLNALASDADAGLTTGSDATFRYLCEKLLALTGAELSPHNPPPVSRTLVEADLSRSWRSARQQHQNQRP
jgi:hypothetical protein